MTEKGNDHVDLGETMNKGHPPWMPQKRISNFGSIMSRFGQGGPTRNPYGGGPVNGPLEKKRSKGISPYGSNINSKKVTS